MNGNHGKVFISVCGDREDLLVFVAAMRVHFQQTSEAGKKKEIKKIGNIVPESLELSNTELNCYTGNIGFVVLESENYKQTITCVTCGLARRQWQVNEMNVCGFCMKG